MDIKLGERQGDASFHTQYHDMLGLFKCESETNEREREREGVRELEVERVSERVKVVSCHRLPVAHPGNTHAFSGTCIG